MVQRGGRLVAVSVVAGSILVALLGGRMLSHSGGYTAQGLHIRTHERVMVIAPHSDDEVLGPGGTIQKVLASGGRVKVVLLTNGDGFTRAAKYRFPGTQLTHTHYLWLAFIRQSETLAALDILGLGRQDVVFMGFPDRGTAAEWEEHWSPQNPYASPYTGLNSTYHNSYKPHAPFCGMEIANQFLKLFREFRPTLVILPHPGDNHPDHWAACNFALYALAQLRREDRLSPPAGPYAPRIMTYLVHSQDWPPSGLSAVPASLAPPPSFPRAGMSWLTIPLTGAQARFKRRAILAYRSQVEVMARFLLSFAQPNELFDVLAPSPDIGRTPTPVILDRRGDIPPGQWPGWDITGVLLAADSDRLSITLRTAGKIMPFMTYRLHLHAVPAQPGGESQVQDYRLFYRGKWMAAPEKRGGIEGTAHPVRVSGGAAVVWLPIAATGPSGEIFISAESAIKNRILDRTAWRLVTVAPGR